MFARVELLVLDQVMIFFHIEFVSPRTVFIGLASSCCTASWVKVDGIITLRSRTQLRVTYYLNFSYHRSVTQLVYSATTFIFRYDCHFHIYFLTGAEVIYLPYFIG